MRFNGETSEFNPLEYDYLKPTNDAWNEVVKSIDDRVLTYTFWLQNAISEARVLPLALSIHVWYYSGYVLAMHARFLAPNIDLEAYVHSDK